MCNIYNAKFKIALLFRLLYVKNLDLNVLRLYYSKKNDTVRYVALSYY
jgi:hypothetical protein